MKTKNLGESKLLCASQSCSNVLPGKPGDHCWAGDYCEECEIATGGGELVTPTDPDPDGLFDADYWCHGCGDGVPAGDETWRTGESYCEGCIDDEEALADSLDPAGGDEG